jgi:hypothetical protein
MQEQVKKETGAAIDLARGGTRTMSMVRKE